jgi:tetratricopeptide (TPR) repeat protein
MLKPILLWTFMLVLPGQLTAAKVKARFQNQDKKAITEGQAKLVEKNSGKEYGAKINKKGEAEFDKVAPAEYQLQGYAEGHMMNKSDWVTIENTETPLSLTLVSEDFYRKKETEGNTALTQGKYAEAADCYKGLLAFIPQEGILWSNLAKAYIGAREPEKARQAAQKAAGLDPKQYGDLETQIKGWLSLEEGRQALENRDFPKAVQLLTQALAVDASNADTYYALALAYGHQKKYPEALQNIEAALKLKPDDAGFLEVKRILSHNAAVSKK